ncbi:MAG: class I tRNA ligase family protein, partial [Patescibacteria group bacterium]
MKPGERYDHKAIEKQWQSLWAKARLDQTDITGAKPPFYNLMMFPYPSAEGLHVGNMYAFTGSDIYGRFKRMRGFNVFEPIGLDGFGIHSENYAFKIGRHPADQAKVSQERFYQQLQQIGAMYDWSRTLETYNPDYYRWTQWLFVQMFKHGLAYRGKAEVNWCPSCKTVLADEQVVSGGCERCGNIVEKRLLEQWFFRITAYAGKLLENLNSLDWSEKVKIAQRNWIGKKEGINIAYPVINEGG